MSSVLYVGSVNISYLDPTGLEAIDYIAFSISTAVFVAYYLYHRYLTTHHPHTTVASHVDFSRMSWTKNMYYDYKNRVTTIQTFRSALIISRFFFIIIGFCIGTVGLSAGSTDWWAAFRGPVPLAAARNVVPFMIFFFSFGSLCFTVQALYYLHFHTQVEDVSDEESLALGVPACGQTAVERAEQIKACAAVLALQSNDHFRHAWRSLLCGFAYMMWTTSPYLFLLASLVTTISFYMNDIYFAYELPSLNQKVSNLAMTTSSRQPGVVSLQEAHDEGNIVDRALLVKRAEIAEVFRSLS
ncbi:transmembrane protein, putative [Bodo saltans]|uniref:Transmembrane protein, putative n=1 Tax=Bodo saltans TaxID=75058 RepID=A0A0S4J321_BODSA|nr:transmembrane protein, putative [Bodo saltans]|eukprot:CUG74439.1 transmembrane protein, putative [Bodo saltans]